jgi:hypothetical protein
MKKFYLLLFIISPVVFLACKKENGSASVLRSYTDSMGLFNFTYTNNMATTIFTSNWKKYISFQHKENYIKAIGIDMETEYFLNSFKLPVRIVYSYDGSNTHEVNYYYKAGTKILDSVVSNVGYAGTIKDKYTFAYNGENIEKVIVTSYYSYTSAVSQSFLSYTYSSAPNVFRNSDPLLFIYTNPLGLFNYHSLLFYFPKTFSASTFATCSYPDYTGTKMVKLNYSTNSDGKIVKEWYEGFAHPHEYGYGH